MTQPSELLSITETLVDETENFVVNLCEHLDLAITNDEQIRQLTEKYIRFIMKHVKITLDKDAFDEG